MKKTLSITRSERQDLINYLMGKRGFSKSEAAEYVDFYYQKWEGP